MGRGPYGYQVGAFGEGWSEWNDRFRNYVRDFWRGNTHGLAELGPASRRLARRLRPRQLARGASVNYVTAHDGFTLRDLVTYDVKHNGGNGESNRDGTDDNRLELRRRGRDRIHAGNPCLAAAADPEPHGHARAGRRASR